MPGKNTIQSHLLALAASLSLSQCAMAPAEPRIIDLAGLQQVIKKPAEEIKVINFWATWCAPCIKEMPLFEQLGKDRSDVQVTLVSLDLDLDPNPEKVVRFVKQHEIKSAVLILDAGDPNEWIDKIDPQWSGALPATLILNSKTGKRLLVERELHEGDLEKLIAQVQ